MAEKYYIKKTGVYYLDFTEFKEGRPRNYREVGSKKDLESFIKKKKLKKENFTLRKETELEYIKRVVFTKINTKFFQSLKERKISINMPESDFKLQDLLMNIDHLEVPFETYKNKRKRKYEKPLSYLVDLEDIVLREEDFEYFKETIDYFGINVIAADLTVFQFVDRLRPQKPNIKFLHDKRLELKEINEEAERKERVEKENGGKLTARDQQVKVMAVMSTNESKKKMAQDVVLCKKVKAFNLAESLMKYLLSEDMDEKSNELLNFYKSNKSKVQDAQLVMYLDEEELNKSFTNMLENKRVTKKQESLLEAFQDIKMHVQESINLSKDDKDSELSGELSEIIKYFVKDSLEFKFDKNESQFYKERKNDKRYQKVFKYIEELSFGEAKKILKQVQTDKRKEQKQQLRQRGN